MLPAILCVVKCMDSRRKEKKSWPRKMGYRRRLIPNNSLMIMRISTIRTTRLIRLELQMTKRQRKCRRSMKRCGKQKLKPSWKKNVAFYTRKIGCAIAILTISTNHYHVNKESTNRKGWCFSCFYVYVPLRIAHLLWFVLPCTI